MDELIAGLVFLWIGFCMVAVTIWVAVVMVIGLAPFIAAGALIYLAYKGIRAWHWRRVNSPKHVAKQLDQDYSAIKREMTDLADKPWLRLVS